MSSEKDITRQEQLKIENDFLKMKLMLERGAVFGPAEHGCVLPPDVENEFLKQIELFEKQCEKLELVRVYDRIERPTHFLPVDTIPDEAIDNAWKELSQYFFKYGISLGACNPAINNRELYRFATEELFEYEMDNVIVPGMVHCFMYDEFHPDHVYDTTNLAMEDCIRQILNTEPLEWMHFFCHENLKLNQYHGLSREEMRSLINHFKLMHDDIVITGIDSRECIITENKSIVKGFCRAGLIMGKHTHMVKGGWQVSLEKDSDLGCWFISQVEMEGIEF